MASLTGIRVLDLADEPAAFAGRLLADLGADVVRVEHPSGGRLRQLAPFLDDEPGVERGYHHLYHNANKRSVTLDISEPKGRRQLRRLAATSDVLIETGAPGALESLGLGYAELSALRPGLVYASVTPYGQEGPWRGRPGSDLTAAASSGLLFVAGQTGDPPTLAGGDQSYKMASIVAVSGIMVALYGRRNDPSERGRHLDISVQEAASIAACQTANANLFTWRGETPQRPGMTRGVFRCSDGGWVTLNVVEGSFPAFMEWLKESGIETDLDERLDAAGLAGLILMPEVLELAGRLAERHTRQEFLARALSMDMLSLPVHDFPDLARSEQMRAAGQFFEVWDEPLGRALDFSRSAVDVFERPTVISRAPTLGEHNFLLREMEEPGSVSIPVFPSGQEGEPPSQSSPGSAGEEVRASSLPRQMPTSLTESEQLSRPFPYLKGVRVVDLCWILAGPLGTKVLADFGAEVIKIETNAHPLMRRVGVRPDGAPGPNVDPLFNGANTGKLSVSLDLRTERGKGLVRALVARADVVTNNFRPGAMDRMELGYESLREVNPGIIFLSVPGCGHTGPWARVRTLGNMIMAASGINSITGFPGRPPSGMGVAYPDFTTPFLMATTILAALLERDRTGEGQELNLSQLSSTVPLVGLEWMRFMASGRAPARRRNRDPNHCPHGVYPARGDDQWCAIAVREDAEWAALCATMGRRELASAPRFATLESRKSNEEEVDALVSGWTRERDKWETAELLGSLGIAAAPVEDLHDTLLVDPYMREHYQHVQQPSDPDVDIVIDREAIRFVGEGRDLTRAPMMGEHNGYVLGELLGLSQDEIDRLVEEGVVG